MADTVVGRLQALEGTNNFCSSSYLHGLCLSPCLACWIPLVHDWLPSLLLSSPWPPLPLRFPLLYQGFASSPPSPKKSDKGKFEKRKKKKLKKGLIFSLEFLKMTMWCEQKHSLHACTGMCAEILTVSEVLSSRKLMALFTSSLQSWRATMHSSWVFPVTSISWEWAKNYFKIDPHLIQWKSSVICW